MQVADIRGSLATCHAPKPEITLSPPSAVLNPVAVAIQDSKGAGIWPWDELAYDRLHVPSEASASALAPNVPDDPRLLVAATPDRDDNAAFSSKLVAWVNLICLHDPRSLTALHHACAERVYAQALRIVQRPCLAEEVVEDCFWQVWREAALFDAARGSVLAWLMTITRSRAIDSVRRQVTVAKYETSLDAVYSLDPQCIELGPLELVDRGQRILHVKQLMYSLDPVQRQLLSLAYFAGLTQREIARQCRMPLGTVKSHIRRGLACLQSKYVAASVHDESVAVLGKTDLAPGIRIP